MNNQEIPNNEFDDQIYEEDNTQSDHQYRRRMPSQRGGAWYVINENKTKILLLCNYIYCTEQQQTYNQ